jgi:uncharacterized protein YjbI with pentapeptide repeats
MEPETSSDQRPVIQASEILAKIARGEPVEYDGVIIEGDLEYPNDEKHIKLSTGLEKIHSAITITDSEIRGRVNFGYARFVERISFKEVNFNGYADFRYARFGDGSDFTEAEFYVDSSFREAEFGRYTNFREAKFGGKLGFGGDTDFNGAEFMDADFEGAKFNGRDNQFIGTKFNGEANFCRTEFAKFGRWDTRHSFIDAKFCGDADFSEAKFEAYAFFTGAEFIKNISFKRAEFDHANFSLAKFEGIAHFDGAEFGEDVDFKGAEFGGITHFDRAKFDGYLEIYRAQFKREIYLKDTKFSQHANQEMVCRIAKRTNEVQGNNLTADDNFYMEMEAIRLGNGIKGTEKLVWPWEMKVSEWFKLVGSKVTSAL